MHEVINEVQSGAALPIADAEIEAMLKAGVHLGHSKSKNHASMAPFLFGVRNGIAIIDLIKTKEKLAGALVFLKKIAATNGIILLAGTRPAARKFILEVAEKTKMPYFIERWIGGTLTNFKVVSKRVEYMETLEREKATGELAKYTKREQLQKGVELDKLHKNFDGLRTLKRLPDAVFIVDTTHDTTAVREARRMGIPIIALVDSNANAAQITYPIPANDDALPAVRYMIGRIGQTIEEGLKEEKSEALNSKSETNPKS